MRPEFGLSPVGWRVEYTKILLFEVDVFIFSYKIMVNIPSYISLY